MLKNVLLHIPKRFCGPPNSANGGYTGGLMATHLPFLPEVTLRKPPPLETDLQLSITDSTAKLLYQDQLIAEAKVTDFELTIPPSVSFSEAQKATHTIKSYQNSPIPRCFVCGNDRQKGDGLRIHPGAINNRQVVAPWIPFTALGNKKGEVGLEFIWSALDCPGAWAIQDDEQLFLLGRMAVQQTRPVFPEHKYVISGWKIAEKGRKYTSGTAIHDANSGEVCAFARQIWIALRPEDMEKFAL